MVTSGQINIAKTMRNNRHQNHQNTMKNCGNTATDLGISPYFSVADLAQVVYASKHIS